jgi:hypothetical protein
MKNIYRRISYLALAMMAAAGVSNASAYIYGEGGDYWSTLHNNTNGCVRAYVAGKIYDVAPHKTRQFQVDDHDYVRYLVSVFPTSKCGGKAVKSVKFANDQRDWWL